MKKLIIAAMVACAAIISQAATVQWKASTIYAAVAADGTPGSANTEKWGATGHKGNMYVYYFATETDWNTAKSLTAKQIFDTYGTGVGAKSSKAGSTLGTTIKFENQPDGTDEKPITIYGMALFVDTQSAASFDNVDAFIKTDFKSGSYQDGNGIDFSGLGSAAKWTAVSAVPEPTSGLLLLLGVAGLALRRRRA